MAGIDSDPSIVAETRLRLLGTLRVERESLEAGRRVTQDQHLPTRKVESLLAYLAFYPAAHSRAKLAALLWGDSPDEQARGSLRKALTLLRDHLGDDLLLADRETVQLNPAFPLWVDACAFQAQADAFLAATEILMLPAPDRWIWSLYRGELLADFYDDWIIPLREQSARSFLAVLLRLIQDAETVQADNERAIDLAGLLLRHDPANEDGHRSLMQAYAATGPPCRSPGAVRPV